MLCRRLLIVIALATSCVLPFDAAALTVLSVPTAELIESSAVIFHGDCVDVRVLDRRAQGRGVWTRFAFKVREVIKGPRAIRGRFEFEMPGGVLADYGQLTPGMPTFRAGEEVVLMLEAFGSGETAGFVPTGAAQGKFGVTRDRARRKVVTRQLDSVHLVERDGTTGRLRAARPPRQTTARLVPFLKTVRAQVEVAR